LRLDMLQKHPEAFGTDYAESLQEPECCWVERFGKLVNQSDNCMFLADDGGPLAGAATVRRGQGAKQRHWAGIGGVYVRPPYRGRGLADQLIHAIVDWSRQRDIAVLRIAAVTVNLPAIRCYARCGFQVCGVSPDEIRVGAASYDELLMWRRV